MENNKIAVFLDRDGTINEEVGYLKDIKDLKIIKGSAQAIKKLNQANILTILVTNQSGVARGYYDESVIAKLHKRLSELLSEEGAYLDAIYYCPHLKQGIIQEYSIDCKCRKPDIGMLLKAQADFNIDLSKSFMIGDNQTDIEAGQRAGCKTILVKTSYRKYLMHNNTTQPDFIAQNLQEAVQWIFNCYLVG